MSAGCPPRRGEIERVEERSWPGGSRHVHITDGGPSGRFQVNTFGRALARLTRPLEGAAQVVHFRRGRPSPAVAIGERVDDVGRHRLEVISPALGPDGPYVEVIGVSARDLVPNPAPMPEASSFIRALSAYREDPSDDNWDRANAALAVWGRATERRPLPRSAVRPPAPGR